MIAIKTFVELVEDANIEHLWKQSIKITFQRILQSYNIKHVKARVKHPQSNVKVEKIFHTIKVLRNHFSSWERAIEYYNFKRPHSSLENGKLRAPYEAFLDKMRENKKRAC